MRPRLSLKTKLVLAISGMVVAVVATLSSVYISQVLRQRIEDAYQGAEFVAHQIFHAAREAIDQEQARAQSTPSPGAPNPGIAEVLQADPGLNALLQSIVGYSPTVYDAAIAGIDNRALLHTDVFMLGQELDRREEFEVIRRGGFRERLSVVYGPPRVYEIRIPLQRDGAPFGDIRVGLSTIFLKRELEPQLNRALGLAGLAVLLSLALAAGLSNLALRPLEAISRRLDRMTSGEAEPEPVAQPRPRHDEYGAVTLKIDRLDRQMRDVKEVFSALKGNLDQIMANLEDGLLLFTSDGRAVLVSASAERFIGVPRSAMLGQHLTQIFSPATELGRLVRRAYEAHHDLAGRELRDESGRRLQVSLDFIEEGEERIGALLNIRDAESVRRIEDEIELSQRLAAIGRLTSGVAHEVKNPINAIAVHLEVLRQKLQHLDPDSRRHMDIIGSEIQRLDRVVQTLVDFTRPVELRLAETDLRRIVEDVAALAAPDSERYDVTIVRRFPEEPVAVKVDVDLFKQALLNVVLNGVQAMPGGGTLTVAVSREEDGAQVEVTDQGKGIPPEIRDRIYNLYFTTKQGGSGIGLAMTYRVMQLHNGSVEFESREGAGTAFRLRLPPQETSRAATRELAAQG